MPREAGVWSIVLVACHDPTTTPDGTDPTDAPPRATGDTGTTSLPQPPAFLVEPILLPNAGAPLTAWLDTTLDRDATLRVEVTVDDRSWTVESTRATAHHLLLTGWRADRDVLVDVTAVDGDTASDPVHLSTHTDPLPLLLVPPTVEVFDREHLEPGVTLVAAGPKLALVDADGEVVWYTDATGGVDQASFTSDGHLWYGTGRGTITEKDLSGQILRQLVTPYEPSPDATRVVDLQAMHHDVTQLPDGHLLVLDIEKRWMMFPTSDLHPQAPRAPSWVAGDVVTELTPDGDVVQRWPLLDRLDDQRLGFDVLESTFWSRWDPWLGTTVRDWSHANALSYDPDTGLLLVSLRHQDALAALDPTTGEVVWIVAPPANWRPAWAPLVLRTDETVPGFRYFYHQHAARFLPGGDILMFDNGNHQHSPFEPDPGVPWRSRALQIRPHPDLGTWEIVWSWDGGTQPFFSESLGDADALPVTDNVLVTIGSPSQGRPRIVEVTREGRVVWRATKGESGMWYRSQRIDGLLQGPPE